MGSPAGGASPERASPRLLPDQEAEMTKNGGASPDDDEEEDLEISPRVCNNEVMHNGTESCWNGNAGVYCLFKIIFSFL